MPGTAHRQLTLGRCPHMATKYSNHIARIRHPAWVAIMVLLMVLLYGLSVVLRDRALALLLVRICQGLTLAVLAFALWSSISNR
ncbi:MAG TPA: hypothetical protein VKW06_16610 [Candidatus Angelobacter sp.]|nr:hypothetical protein [Candidatus Angelobacter sp.]